MIKTFDVVAIADCNLILKGVLIRPSQRVKLHLEENELDSLKKHLQIVEILENKIDIEENQPSQECQKSESSINENKSTGGKNDRQRANRASKAKS